MFDMILAGLTDALQLANLLFVLLGVVTGMIAGAIPGVNGPMAIALCIPLSYYMSPVAAIGFLVGLNKGAFFGGAISGVLLNTPGTPESAATTWDGYPLAGGLEAMLDHLASRMAGSGGFPHEVGLFLGYPAEDVEGFRRHGGQGYKYSGLWKVYSDVERAQRCFRQYGCCRRALCRRLEAGCRLVQLFRTA